MISFVYFDLGGVAILDFNGTNNWEILKQEWGIKPEQEKEFDDYWNLIEPAITTGIDLETYKSELGEKFGCNFAEGYSLLYDGFVKKFNRNPSIFPAIELAKKHSGVGLLTNMYTNMLEAIQKRSLLPNIKWDAIVDSSLVGASKPHPKIYEIAEGLVNVKPSEILFIENSKKNLVTAAERGWQTYLYDSKTPEESSQKLLNFLHF